MAERSKPNWLLRVFIGVSLLVHVFIVLHIAGIYHSNALSYIELSMVQFSKPDTRHIPTPRPRLKDKEVADAKTIRPKAFTIPKIKMQPVRTDRMDRSYETIRMPDLPARENFGNLAVAGIPSGSRIANVAPHEEEIAYTSVQEYIEMLKLKIDTTKQYPESAKSRHLEGRVKVQFTLLTNGTLTDIKVVKSSRHKNLDEAAVEAVKNSSPFPKPPPFIFDEPVTLQVNILFELA